MFARPFAHHAHKRDLIRHFTPNWFTASMGTGVFALLLNQAGFGQAGAGIWVANILLFAVFMALYAARWVFYPREAARIFRHPVMPMFLGAIPMAFATIVNGTLVFAHHAALAQALWELDALLSILVGIAVPLAMFTRQNHSLESMSAVWLLPVVPSEVAAASAGLLAAHLPGAAALHLVVAGYMLWALSVPLALGILLLLFLRLVLHKLPPADMGISSWLALGPLGTGALALLLLGHAAPVAFAGTALAPLGAVAPGVGLLGGLVLWAYGAWWFVLAAGITLHYVPRGLPFNMGWWGLTFPLGVFILATNALGAQTGLLFFSALGQGLSYGFALLWLLVAVRTAAGAYQGRLFNSPCLLMGEPVSQA